MQQVFSLYLGQSCDDDIKSALTESQDWKEVAHQVIKIRMFAVTPQYTQRSQLQLQIRTRSLPHHVPFMMKDFMNLCQGSIASTSQSQNTMKGTHGCSRCLHQHEDWYIPVQRCHCNPPAEDKVNVANLTGDADKQDYIKSGCKRLMAIHSTHMNNDQDDFISQPSMTSSTCAPDGQRISYPKILVHKCYSPEGMDQKDGPECVWQCRHCFQHKWGCRWGWDITLVTKRNKKQEEIYSRPPVANVIVIITPPTSALLRPRQMLVNKVSEVDGVMLTLKMKAATFVDMFWCLCYPWWKHPWDSTSHFWPTRRAPEKKSIFLPSIGKQSQTAGCYWIVNQQLTSLLATKSYC